MIPIAVNIFEGTEVKITSSGHRYLGAAIGTDSFKEDYVREKVESWVEELQNLCEIAKFEPQVSYSALVFGLSKQWLYIMRTMSGIKHIFEPLELAIRDSFLPILLNQQGFTDL